MPTTRLRDDPPTSYLRRGDGDDSFIRIGSVLRFARRHFAEGIPVSSEPEWEDGCLVLSSRQTKPFRFVLPEAWGSYKAIADEVRRRATGRSGGKGARYTPFTSNDVFAPLKLVMPDSGTFRAVLTYASAYPMRGHLGVPKPDADLALVYATLAVLNSPLAPAWYCRASGSLPKRDFRRPLLENIPIVSRHASDREVEQIAFVTHQIVSLFDAQEEGFVPIGELITEARERLERLLIRAQRLTETEHRELLEPVKKDQPSHYTPNLFEYNGYLPHLSSTIVALITDAERKTLEELSEKAMIGHLTGGDFENYSQLRAKFHWHEVVNTPPPRRIVVIAASDEPLHGISYEGWVQEKAA